MGGTFSAPTTQGHTKKDFKIVMVGLWAAGKTTLLHRLKLGEMVETIPTVGFNSEIIEQKNARFTIFDLRYSSKGVSLWYLHSKDSDGIIFVVDSTDRENIGEAEYELHHLLSLEELRDAVVLVLANKQDLPNAMSTVEIADKLNLYRLGRRRWTVQPTSAVDGRGLDESLNWLLNVLTIPP